jgi:polysaccharide biosynthesis protein PslH
MKVLQISNKPPWPPSEGGPMAMHAITTALLSKDYDVKVLAMSTQKCKTFPDDVPEEYLKATQYESCLVDTRLRWWPALKCLFRNRSYHMARFYHKQFSIQLVANLRNNPPDIVILESVFMWPYFDAIRRTVPRAKVVLRAHNIEHRIWERIAAGERNLLKRWYLEHLTKRLAYEEIAAAKSVDAILPITPIDQLWFNEMAPDTPSMHLPFGLNTPSKPQQPSKNPPPVLFYHLGSMDWYPNIEAVRWLIDQCEHGLTNRFPLAHFCIAGRNMPAELLKKSCKNITVLGEVPDSKRFIADHHVLVAPLFSGSGIRIKILEAMSLGKAVITTSVGAEGIMCTQGKDILIADTPKQFYDAVAHLTEDPSRIFALGKAASELVRDHYNPETLATRLETFLSEILSIKRFVEKTH